MEIFDQFIVIDEKMIVNFKVKEIVEQDGKQISETSKLTGFDLQLNHFSDMLPFNQSDNISKSEVPAAQFILWDWNKEGEQVIKETDLHNYGSHVKYDGSSSILVRIIQQKEENGDENQCLPLSSDDHLTVQIGDKNITVSAHWLMSVSPMVRRMLNVEMKEKQQRLIILNQLGIDMEQFMEFVEYISLNALKNPFLPNPKNVEMLLKLADFFQVDWLKLRCDMHLINCVEIPLIKRFILIEKYGLNLLKNFFLRLSVDKLRAFYKANHEQLLPLISKEFLGQLFLLCCE